MTWLKTKIASHPPPKAGRVRDGARLGAAQPARFEREIMNMAEIKKLFNDLPVDDDIEIVFDTQKVNEEAEFTSIEYATHGRWVVFHFDSE